MIKTLNRGTTHLLGRSIASTSDNILMECAQLCHPLMFEHFIQEKEVPVTNSTDASFSCEKLDYLWTIKISSHMQICTLKASHIPEKL